VLVVLAVAVAAAAIGHLVITSDAVTITSMLSHMQLPQLLWH